MTNVRQIEAAFQQASGKLGFEFRSPYTVELSNGVIVCAIGLVVAFGSPRGTLLFADRDEERPTRELHASGYFFSILSDSYEAFDENHFIETLNDWGYFGPDADRPRWYSGAPWGVRI
jgi:hypothetical protein